MADLSLRHIDKIYDNNVQAVFDFNLEIKDKEFIEMCIRDRYASYTFAIGGSFSTSSPSFY